MGAYDDWGEQKWRIHWALHQEKHVGSSRNRELHGLHGRFSRVWCVQSGGRWVDQHIWPPWYTHDKSTNWRFPTSHHGVPPVVIHFEHWDFPRNYPLRCELGVPPCWKPRLPAKRPCSLRPSQQDLMQSSARLSRSVHSQKHCRISGRCEPTRHQATKVRPRWEQGAIDHGVNTSH